MGIFTKKLIAEGKQKSQSKVYYAPARRSNEIMILYRWLIFLFSVSLCLANTQFMAPGYALLETFAIAAIYNGTVTAFTWNSSKKYSGIVIYLDIIMLMLLIYFSGGINSELYVFLFFIIGFSSTKSQVSAAMKAGTATCVLYTASCMLSSYFNNTPISYISLIVRDLLFLIAAFSISGINYEVKKYDEMRKREFKLARTDKLTGLANRHYFDQKLKEEVDYAIYTGTVLNILMFDIDNFKKFNDTFGHVIGDRLLVMFSDIIRQSVRNSDIPVRYGGEEFLVMIRSLDLILAKSVGERIRRQLEKRRIYHGNIEVKQKVTVSCGIAQFPIHSNNIKEVIEYADQALYYAKSLGKNITVCFDEIGQSREELEQMKS